MSPVHRLQRKQVIWLPYGHHEVKVRPAVVLEALPPRYVVVATTSQHHPQYPSLVVEAGSDDARRMGLTLTSYFYRNNIAVIRLEDVVGEPSGWCSTSFFIELSEYFAPDVRGLVARLNQL